MKKILELKTSTALILFIIGDIICVGAGMGVPIFCIIFGSFIGFYTAKKAVALENNLNAIMKLNLKYSIVTAFVTLVLMSMIWIPCIRFLFESSYDYVNFGMPLILYGAKSSFIGWIVLMVLISPFLQFLGTITVSYIVLMRESKNEN